MAYRGDIFIIPCSEGGLGYNKNIDQIKPSAMMPPSRNINIHNGGRETRGGTSHVLDSAYSGTPQVMGLFHFIPVDYSTTYVIAACKDGKIYKDASNTIHPSVQTTEEKYWDFEVFDDELYMANGYNTPLKWTGSGNAAALSDIPTSWTGTSMPSWIIKHGFGVSERMWAGGCSATPHTIYASANADGDDFSDANVTTIKINTGDGYGIIGASEFGKRLIVFGRRKAYIIDDEDADTSNWGYLDVQWEGGAATNRLICKTPYDLIAMQDDGEIYSVMAAEQYGDYQAASLTRKSFMHKWINEFVDLSKINQFHSIYDPSLRAIKFFIVRNGYNTVDTALVFFLDRDVGDAWMVHMNDSYASGYDASCSCLYRKSNGEHEVYTGDYGGMIWKLEQSTFHDNSNGYYAGFKTTHLHLGSQTARKHFKRLWVSSEPAGDWDLIIDWRVDGVAQTQKTVSLIGEGAVLGSFVLDTDILGGSWLIETAVDLDAKGKRIQIEAYNATASQDFFVSSIGIEHKVLGRRPQ